MQYATQPKVQCVGYFFDSPTSLDSWTPPAEAGLFAIFAIQPSGSLTPLYFEESPSLAQRDFLTEHDKYPCWLRNAGSTQHLLVAVHVLPMSTREERAVVRTRLIAACHPPCNRELLH